MQCIEGCLLYIPKYEIETASGRLCSYQSMQEKLPVASSVDVTVTAYDSDGCEAQVRQ